MAVARLLRLSADDLEVAVLLQRLVEVAVDQLAVDGAGAMLSTDQGLRFAAADQPRTARLEQLQAVGRRGPCQDAIEGQRVVVFDDLTAAVPHEWTDYAESAVADGLRSGIAVPLLARGRGWAVLDLYRSRPGGWADADVEAAELLASVAVNYLVLAIDRDEARLAQRELAHRSTHDSLTGVANRALLFDRLDHALSAARRRGGHVAVFFLDLDGFKTINDSHGHGGGDAVLALVARRLSGAIRDDDTLARFGGDEFVVVCENLQGARPDELDEQLDVIKRRLQNAIEQPVMLGDTEILVRASIGMAFCAGTRSADEVLAEADSAMYQVKQRRVLEGRLRPPTASSEQMPSSPAELSQALRRDELQVHYQPIRAAGSADVVAAEALLRWQRPSGEVMSAAGFIDVAERSGLIVAIGHQAIDRACADVARWSSRRAAPSTVFVNLSADQINDPDLGDVLGDCLARHGLQPEQIGLEIVEATLIDPAMASTLTALQARGHPLSVDDFGTGYSSLARLIDLPIQFVKVDYTITQQTGSGGRSDRLLEAILLIADKLGVQVVAEGVETPEQAARLAAAGCPLLQGYHVGRPAPLAELLDA